jgi:hypothetical protein
MGERSGCPGSGHDILALGVEEIFAVDFLDARGRVPGETDARGRCVAVVAEDHLLDVDGRSQIVGDMILPAVGDGPGIVPGAENRGRGQLELCRTFCGKSFPVSRFTRAL